MRYAIIAAGMVVAVGLLPVRASAEIITEDVIYADGETALEGYLAYDDSIDGRRPGVLVVHEYWGLNDYARMRARQLAAMGYVAFAADIYGRGVRATTADEAGKLAGKYKGDPELLRRRTQLALDRLKDDPRATPTRVAAIGYCFGGTAVLELARSGADVAAVVSFHGGLATKQPADAGKITAKILVAHGANDPHVKPDELAAFMDEMRKSGADWQLNVYSGAVHTFTNPDAGDDPSTGSAYNEWAAHRSWLAMKILFAETIGLPEAARGQTIGEFLQDYVVHPVGTAGQKTGEALKKAYQWSKEKVTGD